MVSMRAVTRPSWMSELAQKLVATVGQSLRGKGEIPVNRIAHRFGGGGHENAAGCTLSGTLEDATATLLAAVAQALGGTAP